MTPSTKWLGWAQKLQALSQAGLTYTTNPFDKERYEMIRSIAAEMIAEGSGMEMAFINDLFTAQVGYQTPKVDVRGVVFRDEKILLVKELSDGGWTLPGGWVDVNESPSTAAEREVWEESGYRVKARRLLAIYDRNKHGHTPYLFHIYKTYFECDLIGGEPTTSIETGGADFFAENDLPDLSIARTTPEVLARLFERHRHPEWPADFD